MKSTFKPARQLSFQQHLLVQASPWWGGVQEVAQQLGHEHAEAHRVDEA